MLNKRLDIAIHISSAFWTVQKRDVHLKPRFEKLNLWINFYCSDFGESVVDFLAQT